MGPLRLLFCCLALNFIAVARSQTPIRRQRQRASNYDFSLLLNRPGQGPSAGHALLTEFQIPKNASSSPSADLFLPPNAPTPNAFKPDPFSRFVTRGHLVGNDNYYPTQRGARRPMGAPSFMPMSYADPSDYGPNEVFGLSQRPAWPQPPYTFPSPPTGPLPSTPRGARRRPGAVQSQAAPVPRNTKQAALTAAVAVAGPAGGARLPNRYTGMCLPTPSMPRLCELQGENNMQYRLKDVMAAIPSMKKVPQCYRNIPRVSCNKYHTAQHIWREGFCYCKYYRNNAHRFGGQQLECVLNDCGACTQEFYIGNQRLVCE